MCSWQGYPAFRTFCREAGSWVLLLFLLVYSYFPTATTYYLYNRYFADGTSLFMRKGWISSRIWQILIFLPSL